MRSTPVPQSKLLAMFLIVIRAGVCATMGVVNGGDGSIIQVIDWDLGSFPKCPFLYMRSYGCSFAP